MKFFTMITVTTQNSLYLNLRNSLYTENYSMFKDALHTYLRGRLIE